MAQRAPAFDIAICARCGLVWRPANDDAAYSCSHKGCEDLDVRFCTACLLQHLGEKHGIPLDADAALERIYQA